VKQSLHTQTQQRWVRRAWRRGRRDRGSFTVSESCGIAALLVALSACERTRAGQETEVVAASIAPAALAAPPQVQSAPAIEPAPQSCDELRAENEQLRAELALAEQRRLDRELEWHRYMDTLRSFELPKLTDDFSAELPPEQGPPVPPPEPVDDVLSKRSAEVARSLRALLAIEGVRGLDLFEAGTVHDAATGGWIGPVVFRTLDERGRLAGSLCAERLRLEGSRSAHTLTIVLEDGHESRGGERLTFPLDDASKAAMDAIGTRRFVLSRVDPLPWFEAVPELFGGATLDEPLDDGLWNLDFVRGQLNTLMREDAAHGYWRVKTLGGVVDGVLRNVHLEGFDREGRLERRAFCDRLSVVAQDRGVMLLFEEGALERGDERAPFLDGRYRVFLPRAALDRWRAAGIPGLSPVPKSRAGDAAKPGSH
jgi:hypothetical protein